MSRSRFVIFGAASDDLIGRIGSSAMVAIIWQDRISRRVAFLISFGNSPSANREARPAYEFGRRTWSHCRLPAVAGAVCGTEAFPRFLRTTIYAVCVGHLMWGAVLVQTRDILPRTSTSVSISIDVMSKVPADGRGEISWLSSIP